MMTIKLLIIDKILKGEVARLLETSEHTLRYYEKIGLVVPERDLNNIRLYTEENKNGLNLFYI